MAPLPHLREWIRTHSIWTHWCARPLIASTFSITMARCRGLKRCRRKILPIPLAVDYVLDTVIFRELYRLDLLDTTFYAHDGFLNGKHAVAADHAVAEQVNSLFNKAMDLSDQQLSKHPEDVDALFARGWARSLHAVYIGLVERSFVSALHVALQARSDDEKVLRLDPKYIDAKLIVGVHQYVTGSLPFGLKILAGVAGITGSKSKGIEDLRDAGGAG